MNRGCLIEGSAFAATVHDSGRFIDLGSCITPLNITSLKIRTIRIDRNVMFDNHNLFFATWRLCLQVSYLSNAPHAFNMYAPLWEKRKNNVPFRTNTPNPKRPAQIRSVQRFQLAAHAANLALRPLPNQLHRAQVVLW